MIENVTLNQDDRKRIPSTDSFSQILMEDGKMDVFDEVDVPSLEHETRSNHGIHLSIAQVVPASTAPYKQVGRFSSIDWVQKYLDDELNTDVAHTFSDSSPLEAESNGDTMRVPSMDWFNDKHAASLAKALPKSRRKAKRKPRRKAEPKVVKYVEKTDPDVVFGRGGESNHHPGNIAYRKTIKAFKPKYKKILEKEKERKTKMSWEVVKVVQDSGGRFLEWGSLVEKWYVVDDREARRKVAQALREKPRANKEKPRANKK